MSRRDSKLLTLPATAAPLRSTRDPRIDVFRGLALVMILVDHMPGNPYTDVTYGNIGFSDAAEGFFVLSGIAAGLAYSGRFRPEARAQNGLWAAVAPMWKRSWTLYLVHLMLTLWAIVIFAGGAQVFNDPDLLTKHNLPVVFTKTAEAIFGIVTFGHQIGYVNILPVYSVLLLAAPVAILLALWRPAILLVLSVALWFAAGTFDITLHNFPGRGVWFFNPFSWQLIFVIGLIIGIKMRRQERLVPIDRGLFIVALGWLILVALWRTIPAFGAIMNHGMWMLDQTFLPKLFFEQKKADLSLPRLTHVLAVLYVLSCLPVVSRLSAASWAEPIRLLGRHGLLVFGLTVVLALLGQVLMIGLDNAFWTLWLLTPLLIAVMVAAAWAADLTRGSKGKAERTMAQSEQHTLLKKRA